MEEKTHEELAAWADEIVREHAHDQIKQLEALSEAIHSQRVSTLIQLVGKEPIESALKSYLEGRKGIPKPSGEQ